MNKRVLFIITGLGLGGAENQLVKIALGLRKRSWEVSIYSFLRPSHFQRELEAEGINVLSTGLVQKDSLRLVQFFKIQKDLRKTIENLEPDALVCFMFHAFFIGRIIGHHFRLPVISSIRTEKNKGLRRIMIKLTDKMSVVTVFNSKIVAEKAIGQHYVTRNKARVIPNGVQVEKFQHLNHLENRVKLSQELLIDPNTFIWISVGRLEKPKDYPNLLRAFKVVLNFHRDSRLLIAGEGSERSNIEGIIGNLGISKNVKLLGERQDVPELLSAADAFVLASAWEGFPNVLIEAFAAGLPVVTTDVGGVREFMNDSPECNYIVSPTNFEELSQAMLSLMKLSSVELREIGENGKKRALSIYDISTVIDEYEHLLTEILE